MTILFEISRPLQWRPGIYRSDVALRIWWLWFAICFWPMRQDEMLNEVAKGKIRFEYT